MKWTFRILVIVAMAMVLGIFAHANSGYVQIAIPQKFSLEMSLNFFIIALAALFSVFYALLRGADVLWVLSRDWRRQHFQKQNEALLREDHAAAQKAMDGRLSEKATP
ncbi:MAG: hypothetical protein LBE32_08265 [Burkholderiales bacterium]|jgi:uncharacterized protein HemY|nr:hypothetical protein [Burkholderiales bacterium]